MSLYDMYEDCEGDRFRIEKFELTKKQVDYAKLRAMFNRESHEVRGLEAGFYVKLIDKEKHEIVMSDTWMEWQTNLEFMSKANGDVIIAGLGLGMIINEIQDIEEVTSITVIEKYQEVIDLVTKYMKFNDKVKIICADIFEYETDKKFDTIYFDIWNNISGDNYPETKMLHQKFKNKLNRDNEDCFLNSWRRRSFKALYDEDIADARELDILTKRMFADEKIMSSITRGNEG